jgi:hypothetical protein
MASNIDGASGGTDRACAFDEYGGRGCAVAVPRYEYNNLVFRLEVDAARDPRYANGRV